MITMRTIQMVSLFTYKLFKNIINWEFLNQWVVICLITIILNILMTHI